MTFSREVVIANLYGSDREVEIYKIAFALPYALFQSLGAILVGGLLPILMRRGEAYIAIIRQQIHGVFSGLLLIALLTVKWQAEWFAPGFLEHDAKLLQGNLYLCWSIVFFSALIFPLRLLLQAQDNKLVVSATSFLFSLIFIVLLLSFNSVSSPYLLSLISLIAIAVVYVVYWFGRADVEKLDMLGQGLEATTEDKATIRRIVFGALVYVVLLASPRLIDRAFASGLTEGVVANLDYAMNIYTAFGILIGTSFSIFYARKIAAEFDTDIDRMRWLWGILNWPLLVSLAAMLLMMPFLTEVVELAYVRGAFTEKDGLQVSEILVWFFCSLPFMVSGMLLAQVLVAHSIRVLLGVIVLKLIVKLLVLFLVGTQRLAIFGISNLLMELVGVVLLIVLVSRPIGKWKHG